MRGLLGDYHISLYLPGKYDPLTGVWKPLERREMTLVARGIEHAKGLARRTIDAEFHSPEEWTIETVVLLLPERRGPTRLF